MQHYFKSNDLKGYQEVVDDASELTHLRFDRLRLEKGETIELNSGGYEIGLVIFAGTCQVSCGTDIYDNLGSRRDVFSGKPTTVYIPIDTKYTINAIGDGMLEVGVCKVKAERKFEPFVIYPEDVITVHRGKLNWQRNVNDIITSKYEGKVDKIVLGETYGYPGQWSSYPSHKHDVDNLPYEVNMEEIYHFKVNPVQGFGIQVMYNKDLSLDTSYTIRNGDSIAIKEGYHPVAAAPGYSIYYLWVMAGNSGRVLTPNDDPDHVWVRAVEAMV